MKKVLFLLILLSMIACQTTIEPATNELIIPELIDSRKSNHDIQLTLQKGHHEFYPNVKSETKGFNGNYLGPTIRMYNNDSTRVRFTNSIGETTTVHGHGLHVEGKIDGGPQNKILPNTTWDITIPVPQQASTNWYHPQLMGKTAHHVHAGLAGLYIIEDKNSMALPLPKTYGEDDIPLIIQDRDFFEGKMKKYKVSMDEIMDGKREETLVVNGTVNPFVEVPKGWLRLRLLNASNARFYDFYLESEQPFYKIATEGGFLEEPVEITHLKMAPGERNEIMIDMSSGVTQELMATFLPADNEDISIFPSKKRVLEIRVDDTQIAQGKLPASLNEIHYWEKEEAIKTRVFELNMDMEDTSEQMNGMDISTMFDINGKSMNMMRIDEEVKKGTIEVWKIRGDMMEHPFHMHGTSFLILSQGGKLPKPADRGWKDVVIVDDNWTEIILKFDYDATEQYPYMYHCHILEHEDAGMMGQFTVK